VTKYCSSTPASGDAGPIHTGVEKSIPAEDFTINIELFLQTFTNVKLVRQNWIVSKVTSPGREPRFSNLLSNALPLRHTLFLIYEYIEGYKRRSGATSLLFTLYLYLYLYLYNFF
jgi:hypothetical protein